MIGKKGSSCSENGAGGSGGKGESCCSAQSCRKTQGCLISNFFSNLAQCDANKGKNNTPSDVSHYFPAEKFQGVGINPCVSSAWQNTFPLGSTAFPKSAFGWAKRSHGAPKCSV